MKNKKVIAIVVIVLIAIMGISLLVIGLAKRDMNILGDKGNVTAPSGSDDELPINSEPGEKVFDPLTAPYISETDDSLVFSDESSFILN
jgi:hypothetical protein